MSEGGELAVMSPQCHTSNTTLFHPPFGSILELGDVPDEPLPQFRDELFIYQLGGLNAVTVRDQR